MVFVCVCRGVVSIRTVGLSRVLLFVFSLLVARLLPFTVTRPVTIQKISEALAPLDTKLRKTGEADLSA